MKYLIIPIGSIIYGLLLHYHIYTPTRYHGSAEGNIIFGILFLMAVPFLRNLDKKYDKKCETKNNCAKESYVCLIVHTIGLIVVVMYLYDKIHNEVLFLSAILIMSFCQNIVDLFGRFKNRKVK